MPYNHKIMTNHKAALEALDHACDIVSEYRDRLDLMDGNEGFYKDEMEEVDNFFREISGEPLTRLTRGVVASGCEKLTQEYALDTARIKVLDSPEGTPCVWASIPYPTDCELPLDELMEGFRSTVVNNIVEETGYMGFIAQAIQGDGCIHIIFENTK